MTTQQDVDIEGYVEYALGMAIFLTRLFTRVMLVGFRGLHWDDFFTVIAIVRLIRYTGSEFEMKRR